MTISSTNGVECFPCPECPDGQGMVPQCGSRVTTNDTLECVECTPGNSYSTNHDLSSCKPCTICDPNEETISPCTATKNAVCGECNAGYVNKAVLKSVSKEIVYQVFFSPKNNNCRYDIFQKQTSPYEEGITSCCQLKNCSAVLCTVLVQLSFVGVIFMLIFTPNSRK